MLENVFAGIFKSRYQKNLEAEIREFLTCRDPEKLRSDYTELLEDIDEAIDKLPSDTPDDDPDAALYQKALEHHRFFTDNGSVAEAIDDFIQNRIYNPTIYSCRTDVEEIRYYPQNHNRMLPKSGGWIMVTEDIPVAEENKPFKYSVYFAKPSPSYTDFHLPATSSHKAKVIKIPYYKVTIMTEAGEVQVWANEYVRISNMDMVLEEIGNSFTVERLGGDANYDQAKVHYLMTRGVSKAGVYRLLMNSINSISHVYYKIIPGEPYEFWEFYLDALNKAIRPEMALRLWEHKKTGKPLFNIVNVSEDGDKTTIRKSRKKADPK